MANYTVRDIGEMEALYRGAFKLARAELGVTSFGMQILDLPANMDQYPVHDHAETGQEEVFVVLSGEVDIEVDGETVHLGPESMIRVGPHARRQVITRESPARILALGAVPGQPYEVSARTELGTPDPMAG